MNNGSKKLSRGVLLCAMRPLLVAGLLAFTGCLEQTKTPVDDPKKCSEPYSKVIAAVEIHNKNEVYFAVSDLDFLLAKDLVIDDVTLSGQMVMHHSRLPDLGFALNGTKACRQDGEDVMEIDCGRANGKDRDGDSKSDRGENHGFCTKAHKFLSNGGLSFLAVLLQIQQHKGVVRIMMSSKDSEVKSATMTVHGTRYVACTKPTPPPPPPPVAPKTTIDSSVPNVSPTATTTKTIAFSADQTGVSFRCSLDGATATACTSPIAYVGLANGDHLFRVTATNAAGLSDVQAPTHAWTVDTVPPTVTITGFANLPALTASSSLTVNFTSVDAVSYNCALDGGAAVACVSPVTFSSLAEGSHNLDIRGIDSVGNVSATPASFSWVIDQTAPVVTIVAVDPAAPINSASQINVQFSANESSTLECSIDNAAFQVCTSPLVIGSLHDGSHWFSARATDLAGNQGLTATYSWTTDQTAPVISLGAVVPAQGLTAGHNLSVEFALSETSTVTCSLDGAAPVVCTSPFISTINTEGAHQLVIAAQDLAGNAAVAQAVSWTMDFTPPFLSFGAITPSAASIVNSNSLSVEIVAGADAVLHASLNGSSVGIVTTPIVLSALAEGDYDLQVWALDAAGNASAPIHHSFRVDLTPPVLTLSSAVGALTNLDSNTLTFSANETARFECNTNGAGFADCVSPYALSGLANGAHDVIVRATDPAGNVSLTQTAAWTVDTVPPTTSITAGTLDTRTSTSFQLSASEAGSSFKCALDGAVAAACTSPYSVSGLTPGAHTVLAWATDIAGNADPNGAALTFTIQSPITTSIVSAVPSAALTNSRMIAFNFTASHSSATFLCSLDGQAPSACSSGKTYTGLSDGAHSFKVQAVDAWGGVDSAGATSTWTIDTVAPTMATVSTSVTSTTITVTWTTSEPSTTKLLWGKDFVVDKVVPEDSVYQTSHRVVLTGLSSNSVYSLQPSGTDRAGNSFTATRFTARTAR